MKRFRVIFCLLLVFLTSAVSAQIDTLKVGVYESPPFVIYQENGEMEGVSVWLWEQLIEDLDMPYTLIRLDGERPLSELIEGLESGRIDLAINPMTITGSRDDRIDFSHPFYIGNLTIAKRSLSKVNNWLSMIADFFNPRLLYLVLILVGMVLLFGVLIWLIEKGNQHFDKNIHGLLSSFWWSAVTMTTVGYGDKVPLSNAGRLLAFVWMLCSLIIISVFTASVTSSLTVRKLAEADLSMESFKNEQVGTVEQSASEEFLERNFFKKVNAYPEFIKGLEGLNQEEVDYFIYDEPWLRYQLQGNPRFTELELLPVRFNLCLYAMPMTDNMDDEVEDIISESIIRIVESRDWKALLQEYHLELY